MSQQDITPKHDSTLGLIFRLNGLWAEVDIPAKKGDYDGWNNVLDRIYVNLLYRNDMEVEKNDKGEIIKVELSKDDDKVHKYLSAKIANYKRKHATVKGVYNKEGPYKGIQKKKIYRGLWYNALMKKDIWLRKHMNFLNLYIKETKKSPGSSLFGN